MIPVGTTYRDECTFSGEATGISAALYVNGVLSAVTVTLGTARVIAGQTIQPVSVPTTGRAHGDDLEIRVSGTVGEATETHSAYVTVSAIPTNPLLANDQRLPATGVIATVGDVPTAAEIATAVNAGAVVIEQGDMQAELATYGAAKGSDLPAAPDNAGIAAIRARMAEQVAGETPVVVIASPDPAYIVAYIDCVDSAGDPQDGVVITAIATAITGTGKAGTRKESTGTSGQALVVGETTVAEAVTGRAYLRLPAGTQWTYDVRRRGGNSVSVTGIASGTLALPSCLGNQ